MSNESENISNTDRDESDSFPCIIAAPQHFHLFCRDENDKWDFNLESVNTGSFNHLKLKRVSFYLKFGPDNSPMGFCFDGSMLTARSLSINNQHQAAEQFNRVIAALLLGGTYIHYVNTSNIALGTLYSTGYFRYEHAFGPIPRLHMAWGEGGTGVMLNGMLRNPPIFYKDDIITCYNNGTPVLDALSNVEPSFLIRSISHHLETDYRNSIIYSWSAIEQILIQIWENNFLNSLSIPESKKSFQMFSRNISNIIDVMGQFGYIEKNLYLLIKSSKKSRNLITHGNHEARKEESFHSIKAMIELINSICNMNTISFSPTSTLSLMDEHQFSTEIVATADSIDWRSVESFTILSPIPGEKSWSGEYENIRDIQVKNNTPPLDSTKK